jgi:hypothetical protein
MNCMKEQATAECDKLVAKKPCTIGWEKKNILT